MLLIDQFEELFRFEAETSRDEAKLFIEPRSESQHERCSAE